MSGFSSLSSASAAPSPAVSRYRPRSESKQALRPRPLHTGTSTSHQIRQSASNSSGCRARYLDWEEHQEASPSSSKAQCSSPRNGTPVLAQTYQDDHDSSPSIRASGHHNISPRATKFRGISSAVPAHNEASRTFRASGEGPQTPRFQAHQTYHAGTGCSSSTRRLAVLAQVFPASPITTFSFPSSPSSLSSPPPIPSTPQRSPSLGRVVRNRSYAYLSHSASLSSLASSAYPAVALDSAFPEQYTPSPSPRLQRTHSHRHTASLPGFTVRRGFVLQRARPTLAMSMQIHAPSPVMSARPLSPPIHSSTTRARSQSRPDSSSRPSSPLVQITQLPIPQRPPMPRPPSRSERLLRDTLRRAEEHERMMNVPPLPSPKMPGLLLSPSSPFLSTIMLAPGSPSGSRRHSRKNTASSIATNVSCDACDFLCEPNGAGPVVEGDDGEKNGADLLRRRSTASTSSSSSGHGYGQSHHPATPLQRGLVRNKSINQGTRSGDVSTRTHSDSNTKAQIAYGTPQSPSPARTQLQRSNNSAPNVGRGSSHTHSNSRTSVDGERPQCSCHQPGAVMTPHEAVLRSRLEGVLRGAKEQERRTKSSERREREQGSSSGSGNSMASSRNLSAEGDLFFGASGESSITSLASNDSKSAATATTKSRASLSSIRPAPSTLSFSTRSPRISNASLHSPSTPSKQLGSPNSPQNSISPLTPPPTPPFNARVAAEQCRAVDGYVSFANIEGLGVPEGEDEDDEGEDGKARGRWWQWLTITTGKTAGRERGRSESASSLASR
ncbi:hypothetical protein AcW1_008668 [Taiwanofungus camphoratus]|nr:hypothetical protein AcW1_008668 [Antrodia cinnamomea]